MSKSFENRLKEAKELLEKLMQNDTTLEESIKIYQTGLKEIQEAQKLLEKAELKVKNISKEISKVDS